MQINQLMYIEGVCVLLAQSCLTLGNPRDCSLPGSSVNGILQARILEEVVIPLPQGNLPDRGIEPGSLSLQADSLLSEPPGNPHIHTHNGIPQSHKKE